MVKAVRPVLQLGSVIVKFFVSHVKSFVLTQGKQYEVWCWIVAALMVVVVVVVIVVVVK